MRKSWLLALVFSLVSVLYADVMEDSIRNFIGDDIYRVNQNFIQRIFQDRQKFYEDGYLNYKKILETLKNNGLLKLKFDSPKEVNIVFYSPTSPIFLLRTVNSVLASMGYSYFEVKRAEYEDGFSTIVFGFMGEYMIDPLIMIDEMNKRGYIFDRVRKLNAQAWQYDVTLIDSKIGNAYGIDIGDSLDLKEVGGEYWLQTPDISGNINIVAKSNDWQPKIVFFDKNLQIIDILKKKSSVKNITFNILRNVRFILVSDVRNPVAIKNGIRVEMKAFKE